MDFGGGVSELTGHAILVFVPLASFRSCRVPLSPPCRVSTVLFWSLWERTEKVAFGELVSVGRVGDRHLRFLKGDIGVITRGHMRGMKRSSRATDEGGCHWWA